MSTIQQVIRENAREIITVKPDDTVIAALETMARNEIGAVLVMEGDHLVGIFSERDYARKIILHGKSSKETSVREIMTDKVVCGRPNQSIDEGMALMTQKRCRHLPIVANDKVVAMVSLGDLVKAKISEQKFMIEQLESYILS